MTADDTPRPSPVRLTADQIERIELVRIAERVPGKSMRSRDEVAREAVNIGLKALERKVEKKQ